MTISTETTKRRYLGNGVTTVFAYNFKIVEDSDLSVLVADENDLSTELVLDTDYSVSGAGDDAGGNVTVNVAVPTGSSITILRDMALLQSTDFENQGGFYADTHEDAIDKLTMLTQQQQEQIDRSVKVSETSGLDGDDVFEQLELYEQSCAASAASAESSATDAETAQAAAEAAQASTEATRDDFEDQVEGDFVGTTDTQDVSNKAIIDPSRLDVKKDTEANLATYAALGATTDGQLCFATDSGKTFAIYNNALVSVGGGVGGSDIIGVVKGDDYAINTFTDSLSNATFAMETTDPISGNKSYKITMTATSSGALYTPAISLAERSLDKYASALPVFKWDGDVNDLSVKLQYSTDGVAFSDASDSVEYPTNTDTVIPVLSKGYIPSDATHIRWAVEVLVANDTKVFHFNDIEFSDKPVEYVNLIDEQSYSITQAGSALTERGAEIEYNLATATITGSGQQLITAVDDSANTRTKFVASQDCTVVIGFDAVVGGAGQNAQIYKNGVEFQTGTRVSTAAYGGVSTSMRLLKDEYFTLYVGTVTSSASLTHMNFTATAESPAVVHSSRSASQYISHSAFFSTLTNRVNEFEFNTSNLDSYGADLLTIEDDSANTRTKFINNNGYDVIVNVELSGDGMNNDAVPIFFMKNGAKFSEGTAINSSTANKGHSSTLILKFGEYLTVGAEGTTTAFSRACYLNITAQVDSASTIIKSLTQHAYINTNATDWRGTSITATTSYKTQTLLSTSGDDAWISIDNDQMTLAPGKYISKVPLAGEQGTARLSMQLYDITNTTTYEEFFFVLYTAGGDYNTAMVEHTIEISETTTFEYQTKSEVAAGLEYIGRIAITKLK